MYHFILSDLNGFMFLLMGIIVFVIHQKQSLKSYQTRLFLWLCYSTMLLLILDLLPWYAEGNGYNVVYLSNFAFILMETVPLIIWLFYQDSFISDSTLSPGKIIFYLSPFWLTLILLLVNIPTGWIFIVDEGFHYQRGPLIGIIFLMFALVIIYPMFLGLSKRKQIGDRMFVTIVMFGLFPILGSVAQWFMFGASIVWGAVSLSVLFTYLYLETQREIRDYLTGLMNRQQIDERIQSRIYMSRKKGPFALLMVDLDDFKAINDQYGHKEGDHALIKVASILNRSVRSSDKVARYGGDEFIILLEETEERGVRQIIERIHDSLDLYNQHSKQPYFISLSCGYTLFKENEDISFTELLHRADISMYKVKGFKKGHKGEKKMTLFVD